MRDTLRRARAIRAALIQSDPGERHGRSVRHWTTLAVLMSGMVGGTSTPLPHSATKVPAGTKPERRVTRLPRWRDHARIGEEGYWVPYASL